MAAAATIATLAVPSPYEQSILFRFRCDPVGGCLVYRGWPAALTILAGCACGSEPFGTTISTCCRHGQGQRADGFAQIGAALPAGEVIVSMKRE